MTQTTSLREIRGQIPKAKLTDLGDPNPKPGAWTQPEGRPRAGHSHQLPLSAPLTRAGPGVGGTTRQGPEGLRMTLGDPRLRRWGPRGLTGSAKALSHSTVAVALWSWLP